MATTSFDDDNVARALGKSCFPSSSLSLCVFSWSLLIGERLVAIYLTNTAIFLGDVLRWEPLEVVVQAIWNGSSEQFVTSFLPFF